MVTRLRGQPVIMASSSRGHLPSKQAWEEKKELILDLYLEQNRTCEQICAILKPEPAFRFITPRQLKSRFKEWDLMRKKISKELYVAMQVVYHHRTTQNLDTIFDAPIRKTRKLCKPQNIQKEIKRPNLRRKISWPSVERAQEILRDADVRCLTPPVCQGSDGYFHSCPQAEPGSPSIMSASGGTFLIPPHDDEADGESLEEEDDDDEDEKEKYHHHYHHPARSLSGPLELGDSPRAPVVAHNPSSHTGALPGLQELGLDIKPVSGGPYTSSTERLTHNIHLRWQFGSNYHENFDFAETIQALGRMSLSATPDGYHASASSVLGQNESGMPFLAPNAPKLTASQWAAPYFCQCFSDAETNGNPVLSKHTAMEAFRLMLRQDVNNQFIFPCLSWMVTVLGCNDKGRELQDFLSESCAVIDEVMGPNLTYGSPFHYALAICTENAADVEKYGSKFEQSHHQIKLLWGDNHPNVLVNAYYWAWHSLKKGHHSDVIKVLEMCRPASERIMGRHDLLTINCLVVLSRACEEMGNYPEAIVHLEDALQRLGNPPRILQAYRLVLIRRLGKLYGEVGNTDMAEMLLREALDGRLKYSRIHNAHTWGAFENLRDLLVHSGRAEEAKRIEDEMLRRWYNSQGARTTTDIPVTTI